jgi:hypothetical protein
MARIVVALIVVNATRTVSCVAVVALTSIRAASIGATCVGIARSVFLTFVDVCRNVSGPKVAECLKSTLADDAIAFVTIFTGTFVRSGSVGTVCIRRAHRHVTFVYISATVDSNAIANKA